MKFVDFQTYHQRYFNIVFVDIQVSYSDIHEKLCLTKYMVYTVCPLYKVVRFLGYESLVVKVILYSYLILKKMNERITDS